jgi:hypothetical protein
MADERAVVMTPDQLESLVKVARAPIVDEAALRSKENSRLRMREKIAKKRRNDEAKYELCGHLREDNTSRIAWMTNSDGVRRGVCQFCGMTCAPDHPEYDRLTRIPTRAPHIVG